MDTGYSRLVELFRKNRAKGQPLANLPTIITRPGKYVMEDGTVATVYLILPTGVYRARGVRPEGDDVCYESWHVSGQCEGMHNTPHDIVGRSETGITNPITTEKLDEARRSILQRLRDR